MGPRVYTSLPGDSDACSHSRTTVLEGFLYLETGVRMKVTNEVPFSSPTVLCYQIGKMKKRGGKKVRLFLIPSECGRGGDERRTLTHCWVLHREAYLATLNK